LLLKKETALNSGQQDSIDPIFLEKVSHNSYRVTFTSWGTPYWRSSKPISLKNLQASIHTGTPAVPLTKTQSNLQGAGNIRVNLKNAKFIPTKGKIKEFVYLKFSCALPIKRHAKCPFCGELLTTEHLFFQPCANAPPQVKHPTQTPSYIHEFAVWKTVCKALHTTTTITQVLLNIWHHRFFSVELARWSARNAIIRGCVLGNANTEDVLTTPSNCHLRIP
jgi:hypothetical protein